MKNLYALFLLSLFAITLLPAQEKLVDLPFAVDNFEIRPQQRLNNHYPFIHRPTPLDLSFWAFDEVTNGIVQYTTDSEYALDLSVSENGIYWATKPKDQQFEIALIELHFHSGISGEEAAVIFSRNGDYLTFIGRDEQQVYFEVDNFIYLLDEAVGDVQILGFSAHLRRDGFFWQHTYYWVNNASLWKANSEGVALVASSDFTIKDPTPLDDLLIWQDSVELYRYDGSNAPEPFFRFSSDVNFRNVDLGVGASLGGDVFYFSAPDPTAGRELWQTDGTAAGTFLVKDLTPGQNSSNRPAGSLPNNFHVHDGRLHFLAYDADFKLYHWASDGTSAGTQVVENLSENYGFRNVAASSKLAAGGYLLAASSSIYGFETILFKGGIEWQDIFIGSGNGRAESYYYPQSYELPDGGVVVSCVTEANGEEPWLIRAGQAPLPLGDFTPGTSWSDCYFLGENNEEELVLIAGNVDQGHAVYRTSLTTPAALPDPASSVDWVQTLRHTARYDASTNFIYGLDLVQASDGSFYASGALPRTTCELMHAPYRPAEKLGDDCYSNYVVKYTTEGLPLWELSLPGFSYTADVPILAAAPDAGVYLSSRSNDDGFIGEVPFTPTGTDAYVTRLSAAGEVLWVRTFGLSGGRVFQLRSDQEGNAYLVGTFENQLLIRGKSVSSAIRPSYFVAKFTPAGEVDWLQVIPPNLEWPSWGPVVAFELDAQGNTYLVLNNMAHNYSASCNFGSIYTALVKLNPSGEIILRQEWEGDDAWYTTAIDFTQRGNILLAGQFRGKLQLGVYELESSEECKYEGFVAKISPFGEVIQARVLPEGKIPEAIIAQDDDTYALAGFRSLPEFTGYPGYTHYPFGDKTGQVFVSVYDAYDELMTERTFLARDEFLQGGYIQLIAAEDNQYVLQLENVGTLDTLAQTNSNNMTEANVVIAAFTLDYEVTPPFMDGNLASSDLILFPNPATDFVNIQTPDADFSVEKVRLYNALGQELIPDLELLEPGYYRLNTKLLHQGKYWLVHDIDQEPVTTSFIKAGR